MAEPAGWMQPVDSGNPGTYRIWARDIQSYIKNLAIFHCPETKLRSADGSCTAGTCEVSDPAISNPGNGNILLNGIVASKSIAVITAPADIIFAHEVRNHNRVAQEKPRGILVNGEILYTNFTNAFYDVLHSGGAKPTLL